MGHFIRARSLQCPKCKNTSNFWSDAGDAGNTKCLKCGYTDKHENFFKPKPNFVPPKMDF